MCRRHPECLPPLTVPQASKCAGSSTAALGHCQGHTRCCMRASRACSPPAPLLREPRARRCGLGRSQGNQVGERRPGGWQRACGSGRATGGRRLASATEKLREAGRACSSSARLTIYSPAVLAMLRCSPDHASVALAIHNPEAWTCRAAGRAARPHLSAADHAGPEFAGCCTGGRQASMAPQSWPRSWHISPPAWAAHQLLACLLVWAV